jgi:hypothetical protein
LDAIRFDWINLLLYVLLTCFSTKHEQMNPKGWPASVFFCSRFLAAQILIQFQLLIWQEMRRHVWQEREPQSGFYYRMLYFFKHPMIWGQSAESRAPNCNFSLSAKSRMPHTLFWIAKLIKIYLRPKYSEHS